MSTSRARRTKRLVAGSIALAVLFAGVAFAYFTSEYTSGASVAGGQLSVTTTDLPLDFGDQQLYPTSATEPDNAVVSQFSISNENPVTTGYGIFATDTSTTPDGAAQFQNLYIEITTTTTTSQPADPVIPGQPSPLDDDPTTVPATHTWYSGRLADLNAQHLADLGTLVKDAERTYDVSVWLANTDSVQPEGVPSDFDVTVRAKTPGTTPSTTSTTQP
jgi:hypothetical protein